MSMRDKIASTISKNITLEDGVFVGGFFDAADAILAALPEITAPLWQPIETSPKDGTKFDAWRGGERVTDVYYDDRGDITKRNWNGKYATWTYFDPTVPFTHWMPLSAASTGEET